MIEVLNKFRILVLKDDCVDAKALVTRENAATEVDSVNFVWLLCKYGHDDLDMLMHLIDKGCSFVLNEQGGHTCLSIATKTGQHKIVKKMLDLGVDVDEKNHFGNTALECLDLEGNNQQTRLCVMYLLDAGAKTNSTIEPWIVDLANQRKATRTLTTLILGLQRCRATMLSQNGKDVLRMIARVIWSCRFVIH